MANKVSSRSRLKAPNGVSVDSSVQLIQVRGSGQNARIVVPTDIQRVAIVSVPSAKYTEAILAYEGTFLEERIKNEVSAKVEQYGEAFVVEFTTVEEAAAA